VRDTPKHIVHEIKAQVLLEGEFQDTYVTGSNTKIVATETQKNTLYVLSKKYSVDPIENWAVLVAKDFMSRYSHITAVNLDIDQYGWQRIVVDGKEHNHAFQKSLSGIRYCSVRVTNRGSITRLISGFRDLHVMKTTQSGFEGYIKDEFTTLPETKDRVACTKVQCQWIYRNLDENWKKLTGPNGFTSIYNEVLNTCLTVFGGNPVTGTYSGSLQQTIYQIGQAAMEKIPEIANISLVTPNIHYYYVDFKQFKTPLTNQGEVFYTFDGAAGHIEATIERSSPSKL